MIARLGAFLTRVATRAVPDPFVLALLLTLLTAAIGALVSDAPDVGWTLASGWFDGFSSAPLLAFALQMCLVLVTGHALALSPPVQGLVVRLGRIPFSTASAAAFVALVACLSAIVHWGLGAIVGAFVAREIGREAKRQGRTIHYPLLGGAAYAGLAVWHGGLSGSAPLKVAEEGHFAAEIVGTLTIGDTLLSPLNLLVTGTLCVAIPLAFYLMAPRHEEEMQPADLPATEETVETEAHPGIANWLQESPLVGRVVGLAAIALVIGAWATGRRSLDLNLVNLFFLFLGLAGQGSVRRYVAAVADGARGAGAIIVQFPFYFGILGLMKASGLITGMSQAFASVASATTFPLMAFASAGAVNLFVPSGGGQWAVQGEVLLQAGNDLGVDPAVTVMAFAYGDAWTNMLQPFWALPLLGIMGLRARDIIGYTGVVCILMGILVPALLLLWA
ncbi:MAG: TIGR00366 family protein [Myxococcota bacterium]